MTERQQMLRDLCFEIAKHDGINTFHSKLIFNDGLDVEYHFLNDDSDIYSVSLCDLDVANAGNEYEITVMRQTGARTWMTESSSVMGRA